MTSDELHDLIDSITEDLTEHMQAEAEEMFGNCGHVFVNMVSNYVYGFSLQLLNRLENNEWEENKNEE